MKLHGNIIGEGKAFLILHGFLGMGDNWKTLGKKIAEEGYQVHLIDQRNHGRSPHSETFNYEALAEDLKEYCDNHDLNKVVLLGHSMGGKTAMLFSTTYPEMIEKLIIADIGPKFYPQHHQTILEGLTILSQSEEGLSSRKKAEECLSSYIKEPGVRQFLLKSVYWEEKGKLGLRFNLPALIDNIEEIGKPLAKEKRYEESVLFIRGGNSNYILQEDEADLKKHFPLAQITTIANAGHWLHAEQPVAFFNKVMSYVE